MINYKNTLNLPKTKFSMRANLSNLELTTLKKWEKQKLYKKIRDSKYGKKMFILHDGPPYANGNIHIGHALNKILKDIVIKFKGLMGYDAPYIPGWDCHGLPIEMKVEKKIGKFKKKINLKKFIMLCRIYANKQIDKQKSNFIRLGITGDWENYYSTMNFSTEANIIRTFGKVLSNGYVYRGVKPIHWCVNCHSSLAESEVEYCKKKSSSIYVSFSSLNSSIIVKIFSSSEDLEKVDLIVWTTNPWTLPVNRAIALHPNMDYQLIKVKEKGYIIATKLVETFMKKIGITNWTILGEKKGYVLKSLKFIHPFMKNTIPVVLSKHIVSNIGTGAVHIAPSHGQEDYEISLKYNLEVINSIGKDGKYIPGIFPILDGLHIFKVDKIIIKILKKHNALIFSEKIYHKYPHCWRHKIPVIFCTIPQWFINMNHNKLNQRLLSHIKNVKWIPKWGKKRIENMLCNRPDWCISRQRSWGVPMSIFVHNETYKPHPNSVSFIERIAKMVEKKGVQAWWDLDPVSLLGEDIKYYHKISDTLDVWFDSGSTFSTILDEKKELKNKKIDLYLEGSDQHRGWFMSSLILSTIIKDSPPYNQVLTHNFTVDKYGKKMSKSIGNIFNQQKILDKFGADILRIWIASTDYTEEISVSSEVFSRSIDIYRRIRNTARFLLANLESFNPDLHKVNQKDMILIDQWAINQTLKVQNLIIDQYNNYNFHSVVKNIMKFCSIDMGSFYFDIVKDRQYTNKNDSIPRRSCQTAFWHIIEALVRWIAPIISFTSDEIWNFIPGNRSKFIFTEQWYNGLFKLKDVGILNKNFWVNIINIRHETNKIIEKAKKEKLITSSLEAQINLYAKDEIYEQLIFIKDELHFLLLTSKAKVKHFLKSDNQALLCEKLPNLKISIGKAEGKKCPRCWHYTKDSNHDSKHTEICNRCIINTDGFGENRKFF